MRFAGAQIPVAFSLSSFSESPIDALTSGQKQHLALAGVHVLAPAVLLLDEPTSMLSPRSRESVLPGLIASIPTAELSSI
jgi:energy-coupling factor transporter ATP-binding protein EcfA2